MLLLTRLLGRIAPYITNSQLPPTLNASESFSQILVFHLSSKSAIQRMVVGLVLEEWAKTDKVSPGFESHLCDLPVDVWVFSKRLGKF